MFEQAEIGFKTHFYSITFLKNSHKPIFNNNLHILDSADHCPIARLPGPLCKSHQRLHGLPRGTCFCTRLSKSEKNY